MSRNGTLIPIPPGSDLERELGALVAQWPEAFTTLRAPRAGWLTLAESFLAAFYPQSSSADRKLTARTLAPFPLVLPGV